MLNGLFTKLMAGGIAVLALGTGVAATAPNALAQTPVATAAIAAETVTTNQFAHFRGGDRGIRPDDSEAEAALAEALDITVEELEAAKQEALETMLADAVADEIITQSQADMILENGGPGRIAGHFLRGQIDDEAGYLADALGITVEELEAAHDAARDSLVAQAVEAGLITEEQADLMAARQALHDFVDMEAIMADALGISVEELEAARADRVRLHDLIDELGLDETEVREAVQAGYEAAVADAVDAGIITQEQADALEDAPFRGFGGRGHHRGGPHGGPHGGRGFEGGPQGGRGFNGGPGFSPFAPEAPPIDTSASA